MIVRLLTALAALLAVAGPCFAQSSDTPSQTPSVTPSSTPVIIGGPPPVIGGLSKCENMIGTEKDKCLQEERAGTGSTGGRPAGAGGSHAPGSTGTGAGTMGPQNTAPAGTVR